LRVTGPDGDAQSWLAMERSTVPMIFTGDRTIVGAALGTATGLPPASGVYTLSVEAHCLSATRDVFVPNPVRLTEATFEVTGIGGEQPQVGTIAVSWFQAEAEGRAGTRIRRAGWANRYLEWEHGLWVIQFFSATTKTLGTRREVTNADFTQADFRALDWTWEGIAGQPADVGAASASVPADLRFP
jgi:hypothetical protein